MGRLACLAIGLTAVTWSTCALAEDEKSKTDSPVTMADVFGRFGYAEDKSSRFEKDSCKVGFDIDQQKFVETIPDLQKMGLLNAELSQAKINSMPNGITMAFFIEMLPTAVKTSYEQHPEVDRCQFTQYVTRVDDFGNKKREPAATFAFTREIFKKINWENFQAQKLPRVAQNFHFSPSFMSMVNSEN